MSQATNVMSFEESGLKPYKQIESQIAEVEEKNARLAFDYRDPKGNAAARSQIASLRKYNGEIDRTHKDLKAKALEYGRKVDAVKNQLKDRVASMIEIHKAPLDEIAREEEERKRAIQDAIEKIESRILDMQHDHDPNELHEAIKALQAIEIKPDVYQERMAEAVTLRDNGIARMTDAYNKALKAEQDAAELERLRKQQEENARKERERQIAEEAREQERRDAADRERQAEEARKKADAEREQKAQREREAAADREAQLKQEAEEAKKQASQAKADAERQESERKAAEEAAEAKRLANKKHVANIKAAASRELGKAVTSLTPPQASAIIEAIAEGRIEAVSIKF